MAVEGSLRRPLERERPALLLRPSGERLDEGARATVVVPTRILQDQWLGSCALPE